MLFLRTSVIHVVFLTRQSPPEARQDKLIWLPVYAAGIALLESVFIVHHPPHGSGVSVCVERIKNGSIIGGDVDGSLLVLWLSNAWRHHASVYWFSVIMSNDAAAGWSLGKPLASNLISLACCRNWLIWPVFESSLKIQLRTHKSQRNAKNYSDLESRPGPEGRQPYKRSN